MTTVGIVELKARLSAYVARVRAGEEITVTDRGRPVARLVPADAEAEKLQELARAGVVRIGSGPLPAEFWLRERPADPDGSVLRALLEERRP
jgi:prevent-host-death family protein